MSQPPPGREDRVPGKDVPPKNLGGQNFLWLINGPNSEGDWNERQRLARRMTLRTLMRCSACKTPVCRWFRPRSKDSCLQPISDCMPKRSETLIPLKPNPPEPPLHLRTRFQAKPLFDSI